MKATIESRAYQIKVRKDLRYNDAKEIAIDSLKHAMPAVRFEFLYGASLRRGTRVVYNRKTGVVKIFRQ